MLFLKYLTHALCICKYFNRHLNNSHVLWIHLLLLFAHINLIKSIAWHNIICSTRTYHYFALFGNISIKEYYVKYVDSLAFAQMAFLARFASLGVRLVLPEHDNVASSLDISY